MEIVDILRWLHVVGATILLGTGSGIAFFMVMAHRSGDPKLIAHVAGTVVTADLVFTASAVVLQPVTGAALARETGWSLTEGSDYRIAQSLRIDGRILVTCRRDPVADAGYRARQRATRPSVASRLSQALSHLVRLRIPGFPCGAWHHVADDCEAVFHDLLKRRIFNGPPRPRTP